MKKKLLTGLPIWDSRKQLRRIMKLTILFSLCFVMMVAANSYSQSTKLSLKLTGSTIKDVLNEVEGKSEFIFLYKNGEMNDQLKVNIDVKNATINEILDKILVGQNLSYDVYNRQVIIRKNAAETEEMLSALSQSVSISGKVTDSSGSPLPGVSVIVKGTTTGTITDANGNYSISNIPENAILQFSFVGMKMQEIVVGGKTTVNVKLEEETVGIEEVVAVGYGTQKKVNLTGANSFVSASTLTTRTAPNVQNLLQGKVSGLQITQSGGQPGSDGAQLRIRGMGTFSSAGSDPLVLVDGIQGSLSNLNSSDIESVSVLKDAASAAIYGSRAANGVILVTTKQGKEGLNLEYEGSYQVQQPTKVRDLVTNSADYMTAFNEARIRSGQTLPFTQTEIDAFRAGTDPIKYPNFDWLDYMMHSGILSTHHISANGGNEKTKFNSSLGYLNQTGITDGFGYQRANFLLNLKTKLSEVITYGANLNAIYEDRNQPVAGNGNAGEMFFLIYAAAPNFMPKLSDGSGRWARTYKQTSVANRNPEAVLDYGNRNTKTYSMRSQVYFDVNFSKNLVWSTKAAINYDFNFFKQNEHVVSQYNYNDNSMNLASSPYILGVTNNTNWNILTTVYSTLNYSKTIGKHYVNAMGGYSQEQNSYRFLNGYRPKMPFDVLTELNAGSADGQTLSGNLQEWAIQSYFGRFNYSYDEKYLFEANVRYDGTSRIYKDNRWGVFPSFSAGWRISEENFMQSFSWLDNLKIRSSWGQLGNQNIGLYPYQDLYATGISYPYGTTVESGVAQTRLTDRNLHWEKTSVLDFGFDGSVKNGLFSMTFDWFNKKTEGILAAIDIPASIGLAAPTMNFASMENKGFEIEVGHKNKIGELTYSLTANLSAYKNKVLEVVAPTYGNVTIQKGLPYGSFYLTEWIGIFQSTEDIASSPVHRNNPKPGDLKFKDQLTVDSNGDGIMDAGDNKIDAADRVVVDGAFPKFYYGGSVDLEWRNFDLNLFFQGVNGQKHYISGGGIEPFNQGGAPTKDFFNNHWTPENKSNTLPAMYASGYGAISGTPSTYFLADASYLKLKSLMLGYNLKSSVCNKIGLKNVRLYVSGDNVITISKYPFPDPDRLLDGNNAGNIFVYPQIRSFSVGLNVKY